MIRSGDHSVGLLVVSEELVDHREGCQEVSRDLLEVSQEDLRQDLGDWAALQDHTGQP